MVSVRDYVSVRERAATMGCKVPDDLTLLPRNFESAIKPDDLLHEGTESTVRKLLRQANMPVSRMEPEEARLRSVVQKSSDFVAPIMFVGASLISQQPDVVSVALGVVANYATDMFKGLSRKPVIRCSIVVERKDGVCKKVDYQGPVDGLSELAKVVREIDKHG